MTDDGELLKRLDVSHLETFEQDDVEHVCMDSILENYHWAAALIRELEAERDEAVTQMIEAKVALDEADRQAKKLEALVEKVVAWEGKEPTHVIVPVEPTETALDAISDEISGSGLMPSDAKLAAIYRAMIRATRSQNNDQ